MSAVIGALRADLSASIADFASGFSRAADQVKSFSDKFKKAGESMQAFGGNMTLWVTAPLAVVAGSMVKTAMAAEEMQSAFDVSFGSMADATRKWAEVTGDAMGRSTYELQEGASAFNGLFKAGGPATAQATEMAKQFTVLAQDLASFFDMKPDEALAALRSGLSGEAEPLRRFNVYLTEGSVKAEAYAMGLAKAGSELTEQQKIQARASLIMKGTSEAQGDVIRTGDSATNTVRSLQSAWNELSVTLGSKILPIFTPIVGMVQKAVEWFSQLSPAIQTTALVVGGLLAAAGPVIVVLGSIVSAIGTLIPVVMGLAGALGMAAGSGGLAYAIGFIVGALAPFVAAIAAAGAVIYIFREQLADFGRAASAAFQAIAGPALQALVADVKGMLAAIGEAFRQVFGKDVGTALKQAMKFLSDFAAIAGMVFGTIQGRVFSAFAAALGGIVRQVTNVVQLVSALLRGDFKGAWDAAGRIVTNAVDTMLNVLDALLPGAKGVLTSLGAIVGSAFKGIAATLGWGGDRINDLLGVARTAFSAVGDAVQAAYNRVRDIIVGRLGPLLSWANSILAITSAAFRGLADAARSQGQAPAAPAAPAKPTTTPPPPAPPAAPAAPAGGGRGGGGGGGASEASKAARDYATALADLKEKLDPVSAALAAYNETLGVARRGGVDMTAATNLLAREAVDAAGGWDKLKDRLDTLPPAVAAVARAMRMEEIKDSVQAMADMADPLAAAVREYTAQIALAKEGGLDLATVEPVVAQAAFDAAGGLDVWRNSLAQLPPALQAAAQAALAAEGSEYRADLAATGRQLTLTYDAQAAYNEEVKKLRALLDGGHVSQVTFNAAMDDANESFRRHLADTNPAMRARFSAIEAVSDALGDAANGTKTWQDAFKDLMKELLRLLVIQPIIDRLKKSMMNFATPGAGGAPAAGGGGGAGTFLNIASSVARIFGGFRAEGGPVVPGQMYVVGEEGAETFVPNTPGTILPNGFMDNGPVAPSITVYAPDALTSAWIKSAIQQAYQAAVRDGAQTGVQIARQVIPEEMARNAASSFV